MTDLYEKLLNMNWNRDFTDAPTGVFILLQSGSYENMVYRATLERDKNGNLNRGMCDTPWLNCEIPGGKDEVQEMFVRDSIKAWFYTTSKSDFCDAMYLAEKMRERPHITCSKEYPDGTVKAVLKSPFSKNIIEWHKSK